MAEAQFTSDSRSLVSILNRNIILLINSRKQENGEVNTFPPLDLTLQSDIFKSLKSDQCDSKTDFYETVKKVFEIRICVHYS